MIDEALWSYQLTLVLTFFCTTVTILQVKRQDDLLRNSSCFYHRDQLDYVAIIFPPPKKSPYSGSNTYQKYRNFAHEVCCTKHL